jgi:RHS repeat-associated protein
LYGNSRLAQVSATDTQYFLGDALGSMRQMTDGSGAVTLAKSYDPYGVAMQSIGAAASQFGYTGEQQDTDGLVYLRARSYDPSLSRFMTRYMWSGDANQPMSYNSWLYGYGNPINSTDPSGYCTLFGVDLWFLDPPSPAPCFGSPKPGTPTPTLPSPGVTIIPPTVTCTVTPTPTPMLVYLGNWKITHYNYAMESDSQFPADDKVPVSGLDSNKTYRRCQHPIFSTT